MAVRYYDEALYEKIKNWVKDPNMTILRPAEASRLFQVRADQTNDQPLTLPLISLSRDSSIEIISTAKKPLTYDGGHIGANEKTSEVLNGIPMKLSYQIDIYTRYFAEADEYLRNFIFNLINYPKVSIEIPYNNSKIMHDSTIILESNVSDNSDIPERLIKDQFTRMSLKINIDDAYLFSVPFMNNWNIEYLGDINMRESKGE